jgi:hypothetical protein
VNNPLKDEHCDVLNRCLEMNAECGELLDKLEKAGLDVSAFKEECAAKHALATNLKRTFFPHRP